MVLIVVVSVVRWVVEWSTWLDWLGACASVGWQSDDDIVVARIDAEYRQHSTYCAMAAAPVIVVHIEWVSVDDDECQPVMLEHYFALRSVRSRVIEVRIVVVVVDGAASSIMVVVSSG